MTTRSKLHKPLIALVGVLSLGAMSKMSHGAQFLIADRVTDNVYRYGQSGNLLNTVLTDTTGLVDPAGIAISPDNSKLYVSSAGNNQVLQYDYDFASGTASNPVVFADASDGLSFPNGIKFSQDGTRIFVSNLEPTQTAGGVSQFNLTGDVVGAPLFGGSIFAYSDMAFAPTGELLVGGFSDATGNGGVLKAAGGLGLADHVSPTLAVSGAAGLMVQDQHLYVSGLFAGTIMRFDVDSGTLDPTFGISGLEFPQGLLAAPDGNGFLAGILGAGDGEGSISRYSFDGTFIELFAEPGGGGFGEATAFISVVPEPASLMLAVISAVGICFSGRRRGGEA